MATSSSSSEEAESAETQQYHHTLADFNNASEYANRKLRLELAKTDHNKAWRLWKDHIEWSEEDYRFYFTESGCHAISCRPVSAKGKLLTREEWKKDPSPWGKYCFFDDEVEGDEPHSVLTWWDPEAKVCRMAPSTLTFTDYKLVDATSDLYEKAYNIMFGNENNKVVKRGMPILAYDSVLRRQSENFLPRR